MAVAAILLSRVMYWLDGRIPDEVLQDSHFFLTGTVAELRSYLINIATTILATAGIVFTLFTLPLSTVAAQYGSRLLRVFLGDPTTQIVLGMFVGTFVYCIAAATSLPSSELTASSPQITTTVGLCLMLATFGSLILLVQHISIMLQAPNIAAAAGAELWDAVSAEMPEEFTGAEQAGQEAAEMLLEKDGYAVRVRRTGYVQYIDPEILLTLARDEDLVIRLLHKPGHFVRRDTAVALIWPAAQVDEELEQQIRRAFAIGNGRTPTQDVLYAVNQLVEMAVRAMSPAINDPFTAMTCLDHIAEGLGLFIRQGEKCPYYYDHDNHLRLILQPVTFAEMLSTAFDMLRHNSNDNVKVLLHMLDVIDGIGRQADSPKARQELVYHVNLIQLESQAGALIGEDRDQISRRGAKLTDQLLAQVS